MEHQETSIEMFEKFTWKIANFSLLNTVEEKIYSEPFVLGGYPWRIYLHPNRMKKDGNLTIYLEAVQMQIIEDVSKRLSYSVSREWSREVKFRLVLFNQFDTNRTITGEHKKEFNARNKCCGYSSPVSLVELRDPQKGFIVNDVLIVGAEVFVCKSSNVEPLIQAANLSSPNFGSQTGDMVVEVQRSNSEVVSPKKQSTKDADAEFISAALGRVLYFLKTRKVKDMNEQGCKNLQVLWDELKKFQFDVTWLEPHVQSALGMKSFVEKSQHVEKLKEFMVLLKEKLAAAEVNLDAERELLKSKGFKEIGLDSELGGGSC